MFSNTSHVGSLETFRKLVFDKGKFDIVFLKKHSKIVNIKI